MIYSNNVVNILAALRYKGVGKAKIVSNWHPDITVAEIVAFLNQLGCNTCISEFNAEKQYIINKLEQYTSADGAVGLGDEFFPYCRGKISNSEHPVVLFYKGNIQLLQKANPNVAVIGVLQPEYCIKRREEVMVHQLVQHSYTIVSGLALGCDSIAHSQTIKNGGTTVAILPSTLSNIIPTQNQELALNIVHNNGLLITEYYTEVKSTMELRGRYQERDRLQALFSDAIILTASYDVNNQGNDSGSRLAMGYAKKYQIPRYVMYNDLTDSSHSQFELNRRILQEGDAQILTTNLIRKLIPLKQEESIQQSTQLELSLM